MSRLHSKPPAADHEQHDALLVAQYVANDSLDGSQQRAAAELVSSCGACASLAADLRVVSGVVAWEPVPPRRRDYRLSAARAEQARGSRLQRFMRRLALPEARSLAPAAAGVMSLGLVFVLAGNLWSDSAAEIAQSQPASAPIAADASPNVSPDGLRIDEAPLIRANAKVVGPSAPAQVPVADAPAEEIAAVPARDRDSGTSANEKESTDRADRLESQLFADDLAAMELAEPGLGATAPRSASSKAAATASFAPDLSAPVADLEEPESQADGLVGGDARDVLGQARNVELEPGTESGPTTEALAQDGIAVQTVLIVVGLVLAVGGLLLLLLVWLARRTRDPLVP